MQMVFISNYNQHQYPKTTAIESSSLTSPFLSNRSPAHFFGNPPESIVVTMHALWEKIAGRFPTPMCFCLSDLTSVEGSNLLVHQPLTDVPLDPILAEAKGYKKSSPP